MEFLTNAFRQLFFLLDSVIYGLIDDVYALLLQITRTSIFTTDFIQNFSERIFAIAGIFMLFKVTISLINYVINPDDFSDKNKGFANIAKKIVFSLALLVLVPYIFREAYTLQAIILEENTLMHLVFGTSQEELLPNDNYVEEAGKDIQFTLMSAFLQPNVSEFYTTSSYDLSACEQIYDIADTGIIKTREGSKFISALNPDCFGIYDKNNDTYECTTDFCIMFTDKAQGSGNGKEYLFQTYAQSIAQKNYSLLMRKDLILVSVDDKYVIDYKMGFSTVVGAAVIYLLLLFCIDIAVRSIKLGFLEAISPVPILSYIDPKSGDKGMFKKWFEYCWKTYLSLFLRLFALYIGVYAITIMGGYTDFVTGEVIQGNWLLNVFMILGVLIFIRQLPKILDDALGLKISDGKFHLNPFKKIEDEALFGKQISTVGRRALGTAAAVPLVGAASFLSGHGLRGMGKAFAGGVRGDKFGKNFASSYAAAREGHKRAEERRADGVSMFNVMGDKLYNATHGQTREERIKSVTGGLKAIQDDYASYEKTSAGVDAIAKDFDKRKKAAEAAGDYAEAKRWSEAFDQRVKELAAGGGRIVTKLDATFDANTIVGADGTYTTSAATSHGTAFENNAALANIGAHMDSLVQAMNSQGAGVDGYIHISGSAASNIKGLKNQALGSQQSIETNATTRKVQDVAKYSGGKKK